MANIKVITDSASDLPAERRERDGINAVPLEIRLGDLDPATLIDITPEQFWAVTASHDGLAQTAAPSPGAFAAEFRRAAAEGHDGVCCITISSRLSATYDAARAAAAEVAEQVDVRVIDSKFATMGEGLLVLEAAECAMTGASLDELAAHIETTVASISVLGTLDSLETLRRGGRIGSAQALLGSMLSIKPVIEVRDGVVEGESRQRTRARSLHYLHDKAAEARPLKRIALVHAAAKDFDQFVGLFGDLDDSVEILTGFVGPVIGAHTGPGTIGVCLQRAPRGA